MKKQTTYTTENHMFTNLEKFQSIDVEGDWKVVRNQIDFRKNRRISSVWRAAAIAIILLSAGIIAKQFVPNVPDTIIATTGEEQKEVLLPDGSMAFLNKHTELTYPEKFGKDKRQVTLTGECFFEVTHDPAQPFQVNVADRANVEVLGTSFNINAPVEGKSVSVQVVDGKVAFYANGKGEARKILEKNDQAELQNGFIAVNTRKNMNFLSWKTGILHFDQEAIEDVIDLLGKHYNREILLDNSVDIKLTFTSTIDNQELDSVLEELSLVLGISYTYQENKVIISMSD